jgi:hypothetical protein
VQPTAFITSGFNTPKAFQPQGAIISGNKLVSKHIKYVTHFVTKYTSKYTLQLKFKIHYKKSSGFWYYKNGTPFIST